MGGEWDWTGDDSWQEWSEAPNKHLHEKFKPVLAGLEGTVAVLTMTGSLCPITKAHTMAFEVGRKLLAGSHTEVLGVMCLNSDGHVWRKLQDADEEMIEWSERAMLCGLATEDLPWLGVSHLKETWLLEDLKAAFELDFVQYFLNGADDVLKYQKWTWASEDSRHIALGRPGYTEKLKRLAYETEFFRIGPELPEISSSQVRTALYEDDQQALAQYLHPAVASWCWSHSPYRRKRARTQSGVE